MTQTIKSRSKWAANDLPTLPHGRSRLPARPAQDKPRQYALDIGKRLSMQMLAEKYGFELKDGEGGEL